MPPDSPAVFFGLTTGRRVNVAHKNKNENPEPEPRPSPAVLPVFSRRPPQLAVYVVPLFRGTAKRTSGQVSSGEFAEGYPKERDDQPETDARNGN